jgi:hypothetical protein
MCLAEIAPEISPVLPIGATLRAARPGSPLFIGQIANISRRGSPCTVSDAGIL